MNRVCLLLAAMLIPLVSFADVYKWVDEKGQVHFGDKKPASQTADKLDVKVNTYTQVSYEVYQPVSNEPESVDQVVMYSTSWCGYCKKARQYFAANGIDYIDYDIEQDVAAKKSYDGLGARGVPVILVGNRRMNGFSESGFERIYNP